MLGRLKAVNQHIDVPVGRHRNRSQVRIALQSVEGRKVHIPYVDELALRSLNIPRARPEFATANNLFCCFRFGVMIQRD